MRKEGGTARAVGIVTILMVVSRLFSLWNTQAYLTHFGTGPYMEMYSFALSLPLVVFNGLGTALTVVVIPIFAGYLGNNNEHKAFKFLNNIISISLIATLTLSAVGIAVSPLVIWFTRFKDIDFGFGVFALAIMFPVIVFYGLNYILQGVLQSYGKYNMPAIVSIPYSLTVIAYVYLLGDRFGVKGLLIATFIGLSLQALILVPPVLRQGYRHRFSFEYGDEDVRKSFGLIVPVLIGTSAYQINMLFSNMLSTAYPTGIVILTTVYNLTLMTVLAYVYSITSVYFPKFSMLAAKGDMDGFRSSVNTVIRALVFSLLPVAVGFSLTGRLIIDLIYGYGKFTPADVDSAGVVMMLYSAGIIGIGLKEVIDRAFYSLNNTKTPMLNGVLVVVINIASALILVRFMGFWGIALAYSLSVLTGGFALVYRISKKVGSIGIRSIAESFVKVGLSCAAMAAAVITVQMFTGHIVSGNIVIDKLIRLLIPVVTGIVAYTAAVLAIGVREAREIFRLVKKKAFALFGGV